ncbi:GNAT family N-acetyltransferase [Vibrio rumoiensis 1S-45]|uniref:GNAT family N-acetyltransferase n=2 Tax=Vibrio rumoiensis TaxID=76258 RepID=A0A1E5E517_9VIBR|nr:GNAT family N-acetyltransferase [Vibrio rumoiensis]OEF28426.1 GNAT family N-acetyltransferase [Vibrio rumoiensis 1S-45]
MTLYIRPIQPQDNPHIAQVIREVSAEFGLTADKGYSVADPTLDSLFEVYDHKKSQYWVLVDAQENVVGGAGIAPLAGKPEVCELQKMYLSPQARNQGYAEELLHLCFDKAKVLGFNQCYLESTAELKAALRLYEKIGFIHLDAPWGDTGHSDCEVIMVRSL